MAPDTGPFPAAQGGGDGAPGCAGHWLGHRSPMSLLFLKRGPLPQGTTPAFCQCPRKISPWPPHHWPPSPHCPHVTSPAHSRSSFLLSPFPMTGRGQIIPVEATKAFGEQLVARCRGLWGRTLPPVPSKTRLRDELSFPRAQSRPRQDDIGHQLPAPALTELRQGSQGVAEPSPARLLHQCRHKGQWKLAQLGPWDPLSPFLP